MKLADLATGPDWIIWTVFVVFAVLSIILLSGHGSWFISGYNMASKEEKEKYDEKKLCRTTGIGMSIIAILILIKGTEKVCSFWDFSQYEKSTSSEVLQTVDKALLLQGFAIVGTAFLI